MDDLNKQKVKGSALLPFLIFIIVYMGTGIFLQAKGVDMAFYQLPAPVAAMAAIIFAFILFEGKMDEKFDTFIEGCGNENITIMCIIYLLAGAFSTVSEAMGAVDSTVNFALTLIPAQYITMGIFIISCFISLATGTSVGTVVAVGPIAVGLAEKGGLNLPLVLGALLGGATFGDNLSIISDTTIAATKILNCKMTDKFRSNLVIAIPSAIVTLILLFIFGKPVNEVAPTTYKYDLIKIVPYILVLATAIKGFNVFLVLTGGILCSGILGLLNGSFNFIGFGQQIYAGFESMFEIFVLSILIGGLSQMVNKEGGIQWLLNKLDKRMKGRKSGELGIVALACLADLATANNTVAIIISAPIAKQIVNKFKIDPRRTASILDIFACVVQGIIPYGAQMLIAVGFTNGVVSPIQVIPQTWYCIILGIFAIISIYVPYADRFIKKDPWNFEHDVPMSEVLD